MNELFKPGSRFFGFRPFFWIALGLLLWMLYGEITGTRLLSFSNQQNWSANGPAGYHK